MSTVDLKLSEKSISVFKPMKLSSVQAFGWYLHIDFDHQKNTELHLGQKAYGAWFYEYTEDGWRTATGCSDCGPFSEDDLFVGPIERD